MDYSNMKRIIDTFPEVNKPRANINREESRSPVLPSTPVDYGERRRDAFKMQAILGASSEGESAKQAQTTSHQLKSTDTTEKTPEAPLQKFSSPEKPPTVIYATPAPKPTVARYKIRDPNEKAPNFSPTKTVVKPNIGMERNASVGTSATQAGLNISVSKDMTDLAEKGPNEIVQAEEKEKTDVQLPSPVSSVRKPKTDKKYAENLVTQMFGHETKKKGTESTSSDDSPPREEVSPSGSQPSPPAIATPLVPFATTDHEYFNHVSPETEASISNMTAQPVQSTSAMPMNQPKLSDDSAIKTALFSKTIEPQRQRSSTVPYSRAIEQPNANRGQIPISSSSNPANTVPIPPANRQPITPGKFLIDKNGRRIPVVPQLPKNKVVIPVTQSKSQSELEKEERLKRYAAFREQFYKPEASTSAMTATRHVESSVRFVTTGTPTADGKIIRPSANSAGTSRNRASSVGNPKTYVVKMDGKIIRPSVNSAGTSTSRASAVGNPKSSVVKTPVVIKQPTHVKQMKAPETPETKKHESPSTNFNFQMMRNTTEKHQVDKCNELNDPEVSAAKQLVDKFQRSQAASEESKKSIPETVENENAVAQASETTKTSSVTEENSMVPLNQQKIPEIPPTTNKRDDVLQWLQSSNPDQEKEVQNEEEENSATPESSTQSKETSVESDEICGNLEKVQIKRNKNLEVREKVKIGDNIYKKLKMLNGLYVRYCSVDLLFSFYTKETELDDQMMLDLLVEANHATLMGSFVKHPPTTPACIGTHIYFVRQYCLIDSVEDEGKGSHGEWIPDYEHKGGKWLKKPTDDGHYLAVFPATNSITPCWKRTVSCLIDVDGKIIGPVMYQYTIKKMIAPESNHQNILEETVAGTKRQQEVVEETVEAKKMRLDEEGPEEDDVFEAQEPVNEVEAMPEKQAEEDRGHLMEVSEAPAIDDDLDKRLQDTIEAVATGRYLWKYPGKPKDYSVQSNKGAQEVNKGEEKEKSLEVEEKAPKKSRRQSLRSHKRDEEEEAMEIDESREASEENEREEIEKNEETSEDSPSNEDEASLESEPSIRRRSLRARKNREEDQIIDEKSTNGSDENEEEENNDEKNERNFEIQDFWPSAEDHDFALQNPNAEPQMRRRSLRNHQKEENSIGNAIEETETDVIEDSNETEASHNIPSIENDEQVAKTPESTPIKRKRSRSIRISRKKGGQKRKIQKLDESATNPSDENEMNNLLSNEEDESRASTPEPEPGKRKSLRVQRKLEEDEIYKVEKKQPEAAEEKEVDENDEAMADEPPEDSQVDEDFVPRTPFKRRGRPPGTKNKPKRRRSATPDDIPEERPMTTPMRLRVRDPTASMAETNEDEGHEEMVGVKKETEQAFADLARQMGEEATDGTSLDIDDLEDEFELDAPIENESTPSIAASPNNWPRDERNLPLISVGPSTPEDLYAICKQSKTARMFDYQGSKGAYFKHDEFYFKYHFLSKTKKLDRWNEITKKLTPRKTLPVGLPASVPGSYFFLVDSSAFSLEEVFKDIFAPWSQTGKDRKKPFKGKIDLKDGTCLHKKSHNHFKIRNMWRKISWVTRDEVIISHFTLEYVIKPGEFVEPETMYTEGFDYPYNGEEIEEEEQEEEKAEEGPQGPSSTPSPSTSDTLIPAVDYSTLTEAGIPDIVNEVNAAIFSELRNLQDTWMECSQAIVKQGRENDPAVFSRFQRIAHQINNFGTTFERIDFSDAPSSVKEEPAS